MVSVKRPATYADIQALPEHMVGEIIDGILYASPRPRSRHARVAGRAQGQLDGSFDMGGNGPGGWWLLPEPDRKRTRLNSSHLGISYAVFCLKKKKNRQM